VPESVMPSESVLPSAPPAGSGTQESLYRAALGPVHAEHYLPVFARFDERGAYGPAWNTAAAVGNLGWLVHRQLWGAAGEFAAGLAVWALIAAGLAFWLDFLPLGVRAGLALSLLLLLLLAPGLYGTALLHAQIRRRMIEAVRQVDTVDEARTLLRRQCDAQQRRGAWGVAGLLLVAALLAGWVWTAWPTQQPAPLAVLDPVPVAAAAPVEAPEPAATQIVAPEPASQLSVAAAEPDVSGVVVRPRGHGVNVGLFALSANAERVRAQLEDVGLPVVSDPIESARGPLTRVRVGPFEQREQAQVAAERVRALGLDAHTYAP